MWIDRTLVPKSNPILCGSIASRPSPFGVAMHNAAYQTAGVPFTYVAFGTENTREAVLAMRYLGIRGLSVSMPHKIDIMQYLNAPLRQMLAKRLNLPVSLEHDAKAAALGEFYYGAGRGERSMVYVIVGTGVGAAIIVDGQLYRGAHNSAGEVGHITLDRHGELCSCGSRGCVETYAAGPWLARRSILSG